MPHRSKKEEQDKPSRWYNFHFSGKVIICSVLFGLGLVLIGGLVFAIGINDNEDAKPDGKSIDEMATKAPSSFVGPAIMGIGGFIVAVGIIMCLFETEVCRKRGGDSSPLISERISDPEIKETDPTAIPSTSGADDKCRHGDRKKSPSSKRHKKCKKLHASKDKVQQKTPSPRSPPMNIESPKNYLTASDDNFMTPPSSVAKNVMVLHSSSRDAENQTSTSLMKSFTSSGPSWNTSTEFQTPATSFKDSSSLEAGILTDDSLSSSSTLNAVHDVEHSIKTGFLTPATPPKEKLQKISSGIQKQQSEKLLKTEIVAITIPDSNALVQGEAAQNVSANNNEIEATNNSDVKFHGKVHEDVLLDGGFLNESEKRVSMNVTERVPDTKIDVGETENKVINAKSFKYGYSGLYLGGSPSEGLASVVEENDKIENSDCALGNNTELLEVSKPLDSSHSLQNTSSTKNQEADALADHNRISSLSQEKNMLLENKMPLQEQNCIDSIESAAAFDNSERSNTENKSLIDISSTPKNLIASDSSHEESSHEIISDQISCDEKDDEVSETEAS